MKIPSLLLALILCTPAMAQNKVLYDFVIPRDGTLRQAIDAANARKDVTKRYRIFVMQGEYVNPTRGTTRGADNNDYGDPRDTLKTPNVSIIGENRDLTIISNDCPNATIDGKYGKANALEGIGRGDVLIIERKGSNTYLQDITLKSGMADATGRNIVLNDHSDHTIAKNVCLWAYQDTYVSNNDKGIFYFDGGIIRGRTDYICGKGDVLYDRVTFQQCGKAGYLAVPSKPMKYGYVMLNCYIKSETPDVTYYMGRPWGKGTPRAVFINTQVDNECITKDKKGYNGWADMSGGWPALYTEYNTTLKSTGAKLDLSGRRTIWTDKENKQHENHPVLTDDEAKEYTLANVLGSWDAPALDKDATLPGNVTLNGSQLTWTGSDDALLYAICKNGKVVDFTTSTTYATNTTDTWSVRAANQMGGLGEAVTAQAQATAKAAKTTAKAAKTGTKTGTKTKAKKARKTKKHTKK